MVTNMAKQAGTIIAETLGMDAAEIGEYRYQSTRTRHPVYAIGDGYYSVSKTTPNVSGYKWEPLKDQFWAAQQGTIIWEGKSE